ncbi:hypothetical protein OEB99_18265 [Actinotalea sp. M2MS4P-6]|nr:hypothetical protein [Actinotalea sp. M2MS4P-6]MCV2396259.1 hypothetical protein [Actinotalea sp. M2MS4P-6]
MAPPTKSSAIQPALSADQGAMEVLKGATQRDARERAERRVITAE